MENIPELFEEKKDCCGCGACQNICPKNAISMIEDGAGFIYPHIDENLCIKCGRCKTVCAFQNIEEKNIPLEAYAAKSKDDLLQEKSASGGIFATIAKAFIMDGGYVFGAAFDNEWNVKHIGINDVNELIKLQGSKYVHSSTEHTFQEVRGLLDRGEKVLYSGTPCQIAGLKGYLGKDYENLFLIDIICHGVPSNRMFSDYIKLLESKNHGKIKKFLFRDKDLGWGINGKIEIISNKSSKYKIKKIWQSSSSYLYYFTKGWLYRENCYHCKYTCGNRPADLSLGDFWGIEHEHPEYLGKKGFDESKGISAVIANSQKGIELIKLVKKLTEVKESSFQNIARGNSQLREPTKLGKRNEIVALYQKGGWEAIELRFAKVVGYRRYSSQIKRMIPQSIKRKLKKR